MKNPKLGSTPEGKGVGDVVPVNPGVNGDTFNIPPKASEVEPEAPGGLSPAIFPKVA